MGKRGPAEGEGGRPVIDFNWEQLDTICKLRLDLSDTSEIMQVSESTIQRRIKEHFKLTFEAYRDKKMAHTKQRLIRSAIDRAEAGSVAMHIFLLKNFCKMADKVEAEFSDPKMTKEFVINKLNGDQEILRSE